MFQFSRFGGGVRAAVEQLLREGEEDRSHSRRVWSLRDRMIFHPGQAAAYFVRNVDHVLEDGKHPAWCCLN